MPTKLDAMAWINDESDAYRTRILITSQYVLEYTTETHGAHVGLIEEIVETENGCRIVAKNRNYEIFYINYTPQQIFKIMQEDAKDTEI